MLEGDAVPAHARKLISTLDMRDRALEEITHSKNSMRHSSMYLKERHNYLLSLLQGTPADSAFNIGKRSLLLARIAALESVSLEFRLKFEPYLGPDPTAAPVSELRDHPVTESYCNQSDEFKLFTGANTFNVRR